MAEVRDEHPAQRMAAPPDGAPSRGAPADGPLSPALSLPGSTPGDRPASRSHRAGASALLVIGTLVLAAIAFFALPNAQTSSGLMVQVNGVNLSVYFPAASLTGQDLVDLLKLAPRPGSVLDLTGDVVTLAGGLAAEVRCDDRADSACQPLHDGALVSVRSGAHQLESIKRVTKQIPYSTQAEGSGPVVYLQQEGQPGELEVFRGVLSGKEAAAFTVSAPKNALVRRTGSVPPGRKVAALTFDDGPGPYTQKVLDALAAANVPATFFVLGSCAAAHPDLIEKIKAAGHEVENHSWDHPILTKLSADEIRQQITRTNAVIGGSKYLRPPYGLYDTKVTAAASACGLRLVLWTVDTRDWEHPDPAYILSMVKQETRAGAIILMHDGGEDRSATVAAIPQIVDWLLSQGFALTTLDRLL